MNISLKQYSDLLLTYLRPQRKRAIILGVVILLSIGLQILVPQILRFFIDAAEDTSKPMTTLTMLAVAFLAVSVMNQFLSILSTWQGAYVGWTATNMLRSDLARYCLKLEMSFHNERTPGELIERIDGDITALANFFSQFVLRVLAAALLIVGVIIVLFVEEWRIGLAISLYAVVTVLVLLRMKNIAIKATEEEREVNAVLYGFLEERLAGIDDIRANGGGPYALRRLYGILRAMLRTGRRAWMRRSVFWFVLISLFAVGDVIALGLGSELLSANMVTLGMVFLFYQYALTMWDMVDRIIQQMQDLQKAGAAIQRVGGLMAIKPKMQEGTRTDMPSGPLSVEFRDLTFAYNDRDPILQDVSFRLEPGTSIGLLGRTGSGKTTLTRLLFRLYDPTEGEILIGGVNPKEVRRDVLRNRVAMVTQEVQLFHASVRDNLTFFNREIPDSRILEVIEDLGLQDWLNSLPNGLDTELSAGGSGLSAGEAQLLAFTRVFLRDPGLVVLDEPSSRLDPATERLLEEAMSRLLKDRTAIIIAHRLTTVQRADEIMILENGKILEHDRRENLVANPDSRFSELLTRGLEKVEA